jgi:hypothetical protein
MAPRRKKSENSDMPTGLSPVKSRGVDRFRYRYPNGKDFWFPIGTSRRAAIDTALLFNNENRNPTIEMMERSDKYNRALSYWLPKVIKVIKREESLSLQVMKTFLNDCERLLALHGNTYSKSVSLETVNDFLKEYANDKSAEVYNRKISFLKKIFSYLVDMSAMSYNYANDKKPRRLAEKARKRLKLADFQAIHTSAPKFLKVALELAIQTTHATLEISRIKYRDCHYLAKPELIDGVLVYGYLRIHRQKVQTKESSRVEIPITQALKTVIDESRADNIISPYVVHRIGRYPNQISEGCDHATQVSSKYISREFSKARDQIGLYANLDKEQRPTFHEVRALSIHLFTEAGLDPQSRAAHADAKSTKVYQENHVQWVRVPAGELKIV